MISLDTSGLIALLDRREVRHADVLAAYDGERGPRLVPAGILSEVTFMAQRRLGSTAVDALLEALEAGDLTLHCGEGDFGRIRELVARYADLPLGFADASVVACAERHGGRVLTLDRRDFDVVAREGAIAVLPD